MSKNDIEIIYDGPDFFVVNKPTGISVTGDRSGSVDLLPLLQKQLGLTDKLRLVHRLDKQTSGAMLVAKNVATQSSFSSLFEKRGIKKTYLALVTGPVPRPSGKIELPLARSKRNPQVMRIDSKRGKAAVTNWRTLADFGSIKLLAVEPVTGRTHQIRVHMSSRRMPLTIDPLYGSTAPVMLSHFKDRYVTRRTRTEKPLIDRLTLHAYQLQIPAVGDGPTIFTARLDKKFAAAIKMLAKYNPRGHEAFTNPDDLPAILKAQPLP
jgi:RluA family pseudouridine synthase